MRNGAVLLSTIVMMSAIVGMIGMAGLMVGVALTRSNASIRFSGLAQAGAEAGAQDVVRRLIRNPQWAPAACNPAITYTMALAGGVAVDVCMAAVDAGKKYTAEITGTARGYKRRLRAIIIVDPVTNKVSLDSLNEISL